MKIRIAFTGSSGTGKTVLAKKLAELLGLPFNPVGARSVAQDMGFDTPYQIDQTGRRKEFQQRLTATKVEWETKNESFGTDRSTLDNLAYDTLHSPLASDADGISQAVDQARTYTQVFFCPVASFINVVSDPARISNLAYQDMYEALLLGLHTKYEIRQIRIPYGDLDKRHQFVQSVATLKWPGLGPDGRSTSADPR